MNVHKKNWAEDRRKGGLLGSEIADIGAANPGQKTRGWKKRGSEGTGVGKVPAIKTRDTVVKVGPLRAVKRRHEGESKGVAGRDTIFSPSGTKQLKKTVNNGQKSEQPGARSAHRRDLRLFKEEEPRLRGLVSGPFRRS